MRVLVATLVVALHGAAYGAPRLAIYPLKAMGTSPEAMQQLEAALRIELTRAQDLEIVEAPVGEKFRNCRDVACLVAYGKSLGAQEVLSGEVRTMPDSYSVIMRLFDVAQSKEVAHTAGSYNRDIEEMVWAMRSQVARLKSPQRYAGQLVVEAPAGSSATVNDSPVKLGEKLVLRAGLHDVRVERGGKAVQGWVEIRFEQISTAKPVGDPAKISVTYGKWSAPDKVEYANIPPPRNPPVIEEPLAPLVPLEEPATVPVAATALANEATPSAVAKSGGLPKWPGIVAIVAGVALVSSGAFEYAQVGQLRDELNAMRPAGGFIPEAKGADAAAKRDAMNTAKTVGVVLLGAGAAVTIAGGALLVVSVTQGSAQVGVSGSF